MGTSETARKNAPATPEAMTKGTMKAIVQSAFGGTDVLEMATVSRPEVARDDVLIEVHTAGVDRGVWHLMTGLPYLVRLAGFGISRPKNPIPGLDLAGRVVAVGENVTRFGLGDEVFGIARGAYAEYALADQEKIAHKPSGVSFEQAGVAAISGITALQALTDVAGVETGQSVLVIGASGGVGSYAVQLAKALGCRVTGVASGGKAGMVRELGADQFVDYEKDSYLDGSVTYDVIIDTGGLNSLRSLRRALARGGTLVIVGGEGGGRWTGGVGRQMRAMLLSPFVSQRLTSLMSKEHHSHIERLAGYMADGDVVPAVGSSYPLGRVGEAIDDLVAGKARGKSVIVVRDEVGSGEEA